jgi:hypothetical protein
MPSRYDRCHKEELKDRRQSVVLRLARWDRVTDSRHLKSLRRVYTVTIKDDKMRRARGMYDKEIRTTFYSQSLKQRDLLENPKQDGRIIYKSREVM